MSGGIIKGPTPRLAQIIAGLKRLPSEAQAKVAARGGEEVGKMTRGQLRRSEDPWGIAFQPLARSAQRPLKGLSKGLRIIAVIGSIRAEFAQPYAHFHETGTKFMPARQPLPPDGKLPARWQRRLESRMYYEVYRQLRALGVR